LCYQQSAVQASIRGGAIRYHKEDRAVRCDPAVGSLLVEIACISAFKITFVQTSTAAKLSKQCLCSWSRGSLSRHRWRTFQRFWPSHVWVANGMRRQTGALAITPNDRQLQQS
jgi:hypothetical protein